MFEDILFGVTVFLVVWFFRKKEKEEKKFNLPPGPKPLTVLGYTALYMKVQNVAGAMKVLTDLIREVGEGILFVNTYIAGNILSITTPEDMETMLTNRHNYEKSSLLYPKMTSLPDGLVTLSGEQWKLDRKLVSPVFSTKKLNSFVKVFSKISTNMSKDLAKLANGKSFHCEKVYSVHLYRSIVENMCGVTDVPFSNHYIEDYIHDVEREFDHASEAVIKFYSDPIRRWQSYGATANRFKQNIREMAFKLLEVRKKNVEIHTNTSYCEDLSSDKTYMERICGLDEKYFVGEMNTAIVAGYETTAVTMSYVSVMLALHKKYQEMVYEELMGVIGDTDRPLEPEDLQRMKLLDACINETMRLCPTVPAAARQLSTDMNFGKYSVPKGTHVFLMFFVTHRHPDHWEKPDEFYPEHFKPENVKKRHPFAFIPFSAGGRQCLGYRYAMMSMKSALAGIIRKFHIDTDMKMPDIQITRFFTLDASFINIKLTPRTKTL